VKPVGKNKSSGTISRTMLPRRTLSQTYQQVSSIKVSKDEPWILQQYVTGEEYHTCSIIVDGEVKAFVACPAAHLALNYQALPTDTGIGKAMLNFTQAFVAKAGASHTGHLSFTFLVEEKATETGIQQNIMPVACNPQADTVMVLFVRTRGSIDLVRAYMNALAPSAEGINGYSGLTHPDYSSGDISFPHPTAAGVYFSGQDLVLLLLVPLLQLLTLRMGFMQFLQYCITFLNHVLFWREGTYELWDPLPWFWLYHVYVPMQLCSCIWTGRKWQFADVSKSKILYDGEEEEE
jgi:hypothetical protein